MEMLTPENQFFQERCIIPPHPKGYQSREPRPAACNLLVSSATLILGLYFAKVRTNLPGVLRTGPVCCCSSGMLYGESHLVSIGSNRSLGHRYTWRFFPITPGWPAPYEQQ